MSHVALSAFEEGEYFFKQKRLEKSICEYVRNLPEAESDPRALALDGEAILRAIEAHHGLLVERARGIYSFSHLTLQEYFAARQIIEDRPTAFEILINRAADTAWREITLLTVNGLSKANEFLLSFKQRIDSLALEELEVQNFLIWLHQKSESVDRSYKPAAIRAYYFALSFDLDLDLTRDLDLDLDLARELDSELNSELSHELDNELTLDLALALALALALDPASYIALDLDLALALALARALARAQEADGLVFDLLETLTSQVPKASDEFVEWFKQNGQQFTNELISLMQEHRNFGHDWQFGNSQLRNLRLYIEANKLLVDCLNTDCYISREVRQEIEDTLLLPMSQIEAYKKAHPR